MRLSRILGSVIRFMCGHRLHGRTISTSGSSAWTLSAIEHSVIITTRLGRLVRNSSPVKRSCTSQAPFQAMIFTLVFEATYFARYWSGRKITVGALRLSTTCTALDDVQQMSISAFTSADVLT